MNIVNTEAYRKAFTAYLRTGKPIGLIRKEAGVAEQYVWHTQRDEDVRPSHRVNDGHIFSWADRPATGHPGEGCNCRCQVVPYVAGITEFGFHIITTNLTSGHARWTNRDFVQHYYSGGGRQVDLQEIGHLREIAEQYVYGDGREGAFRRLSDQIASAARTAGAGPVQLEFGSSYEFEDVASSHGDGVVRGVFVGVVETRGDMHRITGETGFEFSDVFADPLDLGIEVGGAPYSLPGHWRSCFSAEVFRDPVHRRFAWQGTR